MTGSILYRATLAVLVTFYFAYAAVSLLIEIGALSAPTSWLFIRVLTVVLLAPTVYVVYREYSESATGR